MKFDTFFHSVKNPLRFVRDFFYISGMKRFIMCLLAFLCLSVAHAAVPDFSCKTEKKVLVVTKVTDIVQKVAVTAILVPTVEVPVDEGIRKVNLKYAYKNKLTSPNCSCLVCNLCFAPRARL